MKFAIKKPCVDCPFRRAVFPYLHNAPVIARALQDDHNWFACHETTGAMTDTEVPVSEHSHCMGAMRVLWRTQLTNIAMRIALACDLLKREDLDAPEPAVFESLEQFEAHHEAM